MKESKEDIEEKANEQILQKKYQYIMAELPKILPIAYLCMIGIGMIFNYYKYTIFGINIFQYASIFDFLIAPFEDYIIFFFTIISLFIPFGAYFLDCWIEKKHPKVYKSMAFNMNKKKWYAAFRFYLFTFMIFAYVWIMAISYGGYAYRHVLKQEDIKVVYCDNEIIQGKQIGKTSDVLFLHEEEGVTKVIPIHNASVKEIQYTY